MSAFDHGKAIVESVFIPLSGFVHSISRIPLNHGMIAHTAVPNAAFPRASPTSLNSPFSTALVARPRTGITELYATSYPRAFILLAAISESFTGCAAALSTNGFALATASLIDSGVAPGFAAAFSLTAFSISH